MTSCSESTVSKIGECTSRAALSVGRSQANDLVRPLCQFSSGPSCGILPLREPRALSTDRSGILASIIPLYHQVAQGVIRLCPSPSAPVCAAVLTDVCLGRQMNSILETYQYTMPPWDARTISSACALFSNWRPTARLRKLRAQQVTTSRRCEAPTFRGPHWLVDTVPLSYWRSCVGSERSLGMEA